MKLYIAEKPSMARAIADAFGSHQKQQGYLQLSNGDKVSWCLGHLLEQAEPEAYDPVFKSWRLEHLPILPEQWKLVPKAQSKAQLKVLTQLIKEATELVHAGDPDREGQLLVDEVLQHSKISQTKLKQTKRLLLNDLTPPAVRLALHETLHRLPIARVLMTSSGMAHITEHLAILVRAGLDFVTCLNVLARATRDQHYQRRLISVRESVERGDGIAVSMRRVGGFPAMAVRMIAVGEESGSLDVQLTHLASEYRKRLEVLVKSLAEIIKPAVILVAGALFLFLIVALLLPVYDLVRQSVNQSLGG